MSRYVAFKDVARMALSMFGITKTEWIHLLLGLPTVEIVRCRECKAYDSECEWCGGLGLEMKPDDFCSYGEREGE